MSHRVVVAAAASIAGTVLILSGCSTSDPAPAHPAAPTAPTTAPTPTRIASTRASSTPASSEPASTQSSKPTAATKAPVSVTRSASPGSTTLPVDEPAHGAKQVITVVAPSRHSTTATLQRWIRTGNRWRRAGSAVPANLGTDGMSRHASESRSATPIGSFTLTRAFGHDPDPGTRLPYAHTTPDDWWISQPGPLYNTRQRCATDCGFSQGDPNEHLYYETPAYDYAVVIDYNTRNAPGGVHQGNGSAFFLHVSEGKATAGCVSIPVDKLLHVLRWLKPAARPRILIGTG